MQIVFETNAGSYTLNLPDISNHLSLAKREPFQFYIFNAESLVFLEKRGDSAWAVVSRYQMTTPSFTGFKSRVQNEAFMGKILTEFPNAKTVLINYMNDQVISVEMVDGTTIMKNVFANEPAPKHEVYLVKDKNNKLFRTRAYHGLQSICTLENYKHAFIAPTEVPGMFSKELMLRIVEGYFGYDRATVIQLNDYILCPTGSSRLKDFQVKPLVKLCTNNFTGESKDITIETHRTDKPNKLVENGVTVREIKYPFDLDKVQDMIYLSQLLQDGKFPESDEYITVQLDYNLDGIYGAFIYGNMLCLETRKKKGELDEEMIYSNFPDGKCVIIYDDERGENNAIS